MIADHAEALLNRTWRPALSVTGADGFPAIADAAATCCDREPRSSSAAFAAPRSTGRRQ